MLCPTAKCYHICGASTGAVRYNAFKSQQSDRNSILLPFKNEPLLMLMLNFIPLAAGYLLKCYKFHKQGFGEAWDKGRHEAFALLKERQAGQAAFPLEDLPNYILMELWMIWNMVPYLWYRLVIGIILAGTRHNEASALYPDLYFRIMPPGWPRFRPPVPRCCRRAVPPPYPRPRLQRCCLPAEAESEPAA